MSFTLSLIFKRCFYITRAVFPRQSAFPLWQRFWHSGNKAAKKHAKISTFEQRKHLAQMCSFSYS
jgi:hypothetical protein